ncbi:MAG TPA: cytosine deaminase [Devosiaceae bacterium]|jgi:cytosine deaminase|nr:cytosine deaminase [Devosiaceae bacterium]
MRASFPETSAVLLRNATLPRPVLTGATFPGEHPLVSADLLIVGEKITAIGTPGALPVPDMAAVWDCRDGLVLPAFADIHTHLDKGHIWPRMPNPDGTFMGALEAVAADRAGKWMAEDIERRMEFSLRCAYAHGTAAIRTHLDSANGQHEISWDVFDKVRERWAGRIEMQAVALVGPDTLVGDRAELMSIARRAKASGGAMGGAIAVFPEARQAVFNAVEIAGELDMDVDLHADETLEVESSALRHLADAVLATGFRRKVLAGHCCVLSVQDEKTARGTIARVAEAGVSVVSLPMCNMYLQHRRNDPILETPLNRGVTLVNELKAAGVKVALASDNTRDPFYAYGDLDCLEVFREGARIAHFDHPQAHAWDWLRSLTSGATEIAGFERAGQIGVGMTADLVLVDARHWTELHSRPQSDRIVLRGGVAIDTMLPDYRELDDLMR